MSVQFPKKICSVRTPTIKQKLYWFQSTLKYMLCIDTIWDCLNLNDKDFLIALKNSQKYDCSVRTSKCSVRTPTLPKVSGHKISNILNYNLLYIVSEGIFLKFNTIFGSEICFLQIYSQLFKISLIKIFSKYMATFSTSQVTVLYLLLEINMFF